MKTKDDEDGVSDEDSFFFYLVLFIVLGVIIGVGIVIAYVYGHYKHGDGKGQAKKFFNSSMEFLSRP